MKSLTLAQVGEAVGAKVGLDGEINAVCTDTRKITPGCVYFAIKGDNFDGHDFAAKAIEAGAVAAVCEKDCGLGERQLLVKSTRLALLDLAGYYRRLFDIPVVGITGSVGKTTTKEMTHAVLSGRYRTLKNEGNLNNEIGVPLTLFRLDDTYQAAVIEMGMSGRGEISRMACAVAPDVAIINNIGVAHIEKLGSRENILAAKTEVFDGMREASPIVLNGDDDLLSKVDTGTHPAIYFGIDNPECNTKAFDITYENDETQFTVGFGSDAEKVLLPSQGRHNVMDALAAVSAGMMLGIPLRDCAKALGSYEPSGMRQRKREVGGITFIEDCYNASPDSQRAALSVLAATPAKRRIAVLGDMLELGEISVQAHRTVGELAAKNGVDYLFTFGEISYNMAAAGEKAGIPHVFAFTDKRLLTESLIHCVRKGDAVLFKASRAMKLEEVIYAVYDAIGKDENK